MPLTAKGMTDKIIAEISKKTLEEQKKILLNILRFSVIEGGDLAFCINVDSAVGINESLLPNEDPKEIQKNIINYLFDKKISFIDDFTVYFMIPSYMAPWINERLDADKLNPEPTTQPPIPSNINLEEPQTPPPPIPSFGPEEDILSDLPEDIDLNMPEPPPPIPPTTPVPTLPDVQEITDQLCEALNTMEKSEQIEQMEKFLNATNSQEFTSLCEDFLEKKGIETIYLKQNLSHSWSEIKHNLQMRNPAQNITSSTEWDKKLKSIQTRITSIPGGRDGEDAFKYYLNKTLDTVIQAHSDIYSNLKSNHNQRAADSKELLTLLTETQNTLNQLLEGTDDNVEARYGEAYQTLQQITERAQEISKLNGKTGPTVTPKIEVAKSLLASYTEQRSSVLEAHKAFDRSTPLTKLLIDALNQLPPEAQQKRMKEFSALSQDNPLNAGSFLDLCTNLLVEVGKPCSIEQTRDLEKHWKKIQTNLNLSAQKLKYDGTLPEVLAYNRSRHMLAQLIANQKQNKHTVSERKSGKGLDITIDCTINKALFETAIAIMKEAEVEKTKLIKLHKEGKIDEKTLKESITLLSSSLNSVATVVNNPLDKKASQELQKLQKDLPRHTEKMSTRTKIFIALGVFIAVVAVVCILVGISLATHGAFLPFIPHTLHLLQAALLPYFSTTGAWAHIGALIQSGTAPALSAVQGFVTGPFVHFVNLCQSTMMHFVYQPLAHGAVSLVHQTASFAQHLIHGFSKMPLLEKIAMGIGVGIGTLASVGIGYYGAKYADKAFSGMRGEKAVEQENNQEHNPEDGSDHDSEDGSDYDSDYGSEDEDQMQDPNRKSSSTKGTNPEQKENVTRKVKSKLTLLREGSGKTPEEEQEATPTRPRRDTPWPGK